MTAVLRMVIGSFLIFFDVSRYNFTVLVCHCRTAELKCSLTFSTILVIMIILPCSLRQMILFYMQLAICHCNGGKHHQNNYHRKNR